jgi:hypothetical protein
MVVPFLVGCLWRTPDTYHLAGIRRGTATSNFHAHRDNLGRHWATRFTYGWFMSLGIYRLAGVVHYRSAHAPR